MKQESLLGKLKSWFGRHKPSEGAGPMLTYFQGEHVPKNDVNDDVASTSPSATLRPTGTKTAAAPEPKTALESPPQNVDPIEQPLPEEKQDVPQDPKDGPAPPKTPSSEPIAAPKRGGGPAKRLRAEDATDQQARQQRYKNFDISDTPAGSSDVDRMSEPKTRGGIGRLAALFIALVIFATAVFGTASWWVPQVTPMARGPGASKTNLPVSNTTPLPTPMTSTVTPQARVETPEQGVSDSASPEALTALKVELTNRMEAIQQGGGVGDSSIISMGDFLSSQARQLAAVSARLATLEAAIGNAAQLEGLNNRLIVLEGKSADAASVLKLSDRVANLEESSRRAIAEQTAGVALLMATAQLREVIVAGRPFAAELETTKVLSTRVLNSTIDDRAFVTHAARGIPSLPALQRRFDETAAQTVRAASIPDGASGWIRQSLSRLMSIITVRRVSGDIAGSSVSSTLARAENRLITGDIAGAAAEMETLTDAAAETARPWITDARARTAADQAITTTLRKAMALMAVDERTRSSAAVADKDK